MGAALGADVTNTQVIRKNFGGSGTKVICHEEEYDGNGGCCLGPNFLPVCCPIAEGQHC